jgi:uncharacterized protein YjbI with pentapeptide repeats
MGERKSNYRVIIFGYQNRDFSGQIHKRVTHPGEDFYGCNFSLTDLERSDFTGSCLERIIARKVNFECSKLDNANLKDADLRGANFYIASLENANLRNANLRNANLRDADLYCADLRGADLRGAKLWGANFQNADLRGVKSDKDAFNGADIHNAVFGNEN